MDIRSYVYGGLAGFAFAGVLALGGGSLEQAVADTPVAKQVRVKADTLWKAGKKKEAITQYMKLKRVEDILGDSVKYVKYNAETGKTNFDRLVYQRNEKVKKPVLVLFYSPPDRDPENHDGVQRQTIVFRDLVRRYKDKVRFVAFDGGNERIYSHYKELLARKQIRIKEGVIAPPTIGLYNTFDIAKGENPVKNDGRMKRIDRWRKGPDQDKYIVPAINEASTYWIDFNMLGKYLQSAKYTYKHLNEWKIKRVDF